jgi:hypothetical protein
MQPRLRLLVSWVIRLLGGRQLPAVERATSSLFNAANPSCAFLLGLLASASVLRLAGSTGGHDGVVVTLGMDAGH